MVQPQVDLGCHGSGTCASVREGALVVALAGQPNVGKSTIFNMLTGLSQHVGNWPGKTVERKTGPYVHQGREMALVDLPGTYSLTANSVEERIARDYIIHEAPDVVVAVVDAAIPERSLYLLAELLLLPAPVVMVLNMMDVAEQEGVQIEPRVLEAALGIPVIGMVATRNEGLAPMLDAIVAVADGTYPYNPKRPTILPDHEAVLGTLITLIAPYVPSPYPVPWVALKLLEGDEELIDMMRAAAPSDVWEQVHAILYKHEDAVLDIAGARYTWIARMVRAAVVRPRVGQLGLTQRLDSVLTHPVWGTLALLAILGVVFVLTYTIGQPIQDWLEGQLAAVSGLVAAGLGGISAPVWLSDLIVDGIIGGVGMVATFTPILALFFATLGLLEDTGYMARAAYVTDRLMHMMGLHGKSFMPLLLGFGCNVPAVLGSRIIESPRARLLTVLLAPLVPMVIAVLGLVTAVLMGYGEFDPSGMPMIERLREMGQPDMADRAADELGKLPMNPLLLALLTAPLAGFTINGLAALGEELGWRGLLQQELAPLGFARASVLIGAIWGVWHAPLILLGHNFPEHPRQGVFVMIAACIVLGVIISWIALRAQTVIAAAVAHGTLNALAGLSSTAISGGDQIEILVLGYAGIAAMVPFAIAALVWSPKLSHYEVAS